MQTLKVCSSQLVSAVYVTATAGDHGHSRIRPGPGDELCSAAKKLPEERGGALTNAALFRINRQGSLCCFSQSVEALGPHHVSVLK